MAAKDAATKNVALKEGATIEELVRALTAIGSTARDIIAILQNLRAAGQSTAPGAGGRKGVAAAKDFEALLIG